MRWAARCSRPMQPAVDFIYLIGLHILGALKHTFFDKNRGIFRMLPFGKV